MSAVQPGFGALRPSAGEHVFMSAEVALHLSGAT